VRCAARLLATCAAAAAQVAPSPEEVAQYTGLHSAAAHGDLGSLERLLSVRPNRDERGRHGRTPLHAAVYMKHRPVVRELLRRGANVNLPDRNRKTPLAMARERGFREMESILLAAGAR